MTLQNNDLVGAQTANSNAKLRTHPGASCLRSWTTSSPSLMTKGPVRVCYERMRLRLSSARSCTYWLL